MSQLIDEFKRTGYVILKGGIPPKLVEELKAALEPLHAAHFANPGSSNRYQTLLEPSTYHPSFLKFLNLESMNRAAHEILGADEVAFAALACLLTQPEHRICKWHRDFNDGYPELPEMLKLPNAFIQFNCALYEDRCLWIVPGSHTRPSTQAETDFTARFEPLKFTGPIDVARAIEANVFAGMPGAVNVQLNPGDCALYNALMWHSAEYNPARKRMTVIGGWKQACMFDRFAAMRWGIEHNPWLLEPAYLGDLGKYFGPQLERYQEAVRRHVAVAAS